MTRPPPSSTLFPYTTLFRSIGFSAALRGALPSRPRLRRLELPHHLLPPHAAIPALDLDTAGKLSLPCFVRVHKLPRSEEHTSELQSPHHLVFRLLLAQSPHT